MGLCRVQGLGYKNLKGGCIRDYSVKYFRSYYGEYSEFRLWLVWRVANVHVQHLPFRVATAKHSRLRLVSQHFQRQNVF